MTAILLTAIASRPAAAAPPEATLGELDGEALKDLARIPPEGSDGPTAAGRSELGKAFRLSLAFGDSEPASDAPARAAYDARSSALTLTLRLDGAADGVGLQLERVTRPGRTIHYAAAGTNVQDVNTLRSRKLDADFIDAPVGSDVTPDYTLVMQRIPPGQAAVLTRSLRVVLTGRVVAFPYGGPSRCSIETLRPTAQAATLTNLVTCAVALRLDRVAFVDPDRGELSSWPQAPTRSITVPSTALTTSGPNATPTLSTEMAKAAPSAPATATLTRPPFPADLGQNDMPPLEWVSSPGPDVVERAYPLSAYAAGAGGDVVLGCLEELDGRVKDCTLLAERPAGAGFGQAALKLSQEFRFTQIFKAGRPVTGRIRIPYRFTVVDGADATPAAQPPTSP